MNTMTEALNKANIKVTDFEDRPIDEKGIELGMQIEFMEQWLKLLKRNASEKEKHNFVTKHGFVSVMQFNLYMACLDDVHNLQTKLDDIRDSVSSTEIKKREEEIAEKEEMARNIKKSGYYKMILRGLDRKDITPYGEDILKRKIHN